MRVLLLVTSSSIEITLEETVTVISTDFVIFTITDFLATLGGSAGLWLGLGVLQILEMLCVLGKKIASN